MVSCFVTLFRSCFNWPRMFAAVGRAAALFRPRVLVSRVTWNFAAARTLYEGKVDDVGASAIVFHSKQGAVPVISRSVSFFETDYFLSASDGAWWKLPLPRSANLQGMLDGKIIFTLRNDWTAPDGKKLAKGVLAA